MVLMGGRVSGYAIAGMWRPEGYNSDVAHLQSEASEAIPCGVRGLSFWSKIGKVAVRAYERSSPEKLGCL